MTPAAEQTLSGLDITGLAAGGDGIARADGLVVFTPRTAPGDRIQADVTLEGRVGRGRLRRIEAAGPARVDAPCPHYVAPDRCGGCQLQHVDLGAQREAKRTMVRDAFQRIARREVPLPELIGGEPWRYRRALTLAMRRRADGSMYGGLRAYDDPEAVFDLTDCLITDERVVASWREILAAAVHLPDEPRLRGTVRRLDDQLLFVLEGGRDWPSLQRFLEQVPALAAVWWQAEGKRRRLVADRRTGGAGSLGASFVQVNAEVAALVHDDVVARAMAHAPRSVIDAYSGAGDTAARIAAQGVRVVAIELDEEATAVAASRLPSGSRAIAARVEDMLPRVFPSDVVIVNPPRTGLDERVASALRGASPPPRAIIYVSCDPATLARDVSRLAGWRVHALACYDMFPQTAHVETVCELRPEAS